MTDIWVYHACPAVVSGERDDGNLPFHFEPPEQSGHLRIVQSDAKMDADHSNPEAHLAGILIRVYLRVSAANFCF